MSYMVRFIKKNSKQMVAKEKLAIKQFIITLLT